MITVGFIRLTNCQSTNERKKMQNLIKTNETGRSMVEMLGVLAIIGVLSVAGVAGYKAAVRKSLANNLLNQASMRATDVATKIGSGNLDALDSDSFAGNLGGGVTMSSAVKGPDGYTDYDESDEQFTLTMEGVDEELCQQMQSMAGGSRSVVREVECVNNEDGDLVAILTFNKDLSANPVASDFEDNEEGCMNSGFNWCSELSTPACKKDCCSDITLNDCQESCNSATGEIVNKEAGLECEKDGENGTCNELGECVLQSYCEKNGGVLKGTSNQFCYYSGSMTWLDAAKKCTGKKYPREADIKKYMPTYTELGCTDSSYSCEGRNLPYSTYWTSGCEDSECEEKYVSNSGYAYYIYYSSPRNSKRNEQYGAICHNIEPELSGEEDDYCTGVELIPPCQVSCDPDTGEIKNKENNTICTTSDGQTGYCVSGICEVLTCPYGTGLKSGYSGNNALADGACSCSAHNANQCTLGYYCSFNPRTYAFGEIDRGSGICTSASDGTKINGHWVSSEAMDWWTANSWCIAKGSTGSISYSTLKSEYNCDESTGTCNFDVMDSNGMTGSYWVAKEYGNNYNAWAIVRSTGGESSYRYDNFLNKKLALCE